MATTLASGPTTISIEARAFDPFLALIFRVGLGSSSVADPSRVASAWCSGVVGRSTISYVDVATYEAKIGGGSGGQSMRLRLCVVEPTTIGSLILLFYVFIFFW